MTLTETLPDIQRLTNIAMLTPDDKSGHGNFVNYEQEQRRPDLFHFLRFCLARGNRDIRIKAIELCRRTKQCDVEVVDDGAVSFFVFSASPSWRLRLRKFVPRYASVHGLRHFHVECQLPASE